jgi:hypothetical protein
MGSTSVATVSYHCSMLVLSQHILVARRGSAAHTSAALQDAGPVTNNARSAAIPVDSTDLDLVPRVLPDDAVAINCQRWGRYATWRLSCGKQCSRSHHTTEYPRELLPQHA